MTRDDEIFRLAQIAAPIYAARLALAVDLVPLDLVQQELESTARCAIRDARMLVNLASNCCMANCEADR